MSSPSALSLPDKCHSGSIKAESGIAGKGVILAYLIPPILHILYALTIWFCRLYHLETSHKRFKIVADWVEKLAIDWNDQQYWIGLSLQIAIWTRIRYGQDLSMYHFRIAGALITLPLLGHELTTIAYMDKWRDCNSKIRGARGFFEALNTLATLVFLAFILATSNNSPDTLFACRQGGVSVAGLPARSWFGAFMFMLMTVCFYFASVMHVGYSYKPLRENESKAVMTQLLYLVLLVAFCLWHLGATLHASHAYGTPSIRIEGNDEREWTFGQILAACLISSMAITALLGLLEKPEKSNSSQSDSGKLSGSDSGTGQSIPLQQPFRPTTAVPTDCFAAGTNA